MPVLVLVHPGSLCGSADFNLGREVAEAARTEITQDLVNWTGDILVLDGDLSDELDFYPALRDAIDDAVDEAELFGERLEADDPEHAQIAVDYLLKRGTAPDTPIHLTGAWYDSSDESGCVNATRDALQAAGFSNINLMTSCVDISAALEMTPTI